MSEAPENCPEEAAGLSSEQQLPIQPPANPSGQEHQKDIPLLCLLKDFKGTLR